MLKRILHPKAFRITGCLCLLVGIALTSKFWLSAGALYFLSAEIMEIWS